MVNAPAAVVLPSAGQEQPICTLRLFLFGAPRIERDGISVPAARSKGMALLAYLAVTRQPQQREQLLACCGPSSIPPARATTCAASCRCSRRRWTTSCCADRLAGGAGATVRALAGCRGISGAARRVSSTATRPTCCVPSALPRWKPRRSCTATTSWPASASRKPRVRRVAVLPARGAAPAAGAALQSLIALERRRARMAQR